MDCTTIDVPTEMKEGRLARWLAALLLGGVGLAFSWFRWEVPLFFNVDFLFGSFFVMLAYLFCGAPHAVAAAVVAYSGTFALYHHPWAFVVFTGEALFVAALGRKASRDIVVLVTAYWVAIGGPLVWLLYHHVMGMPGQSALVFLSKQFVNGVFNALFAALVFLAAAAFRRAPTHLPSFRSLIFTLLLALVLTPALLQMVFGVREKLEADRRATVNLVDHLAAQTRTTLYEWLRERRQPVETLARLVGDPARTPRETMQRHVETMKGISPGLLRMGVIDARSVTVAYAPPVDEDGRSNIGVDLSSQPYAGILMRRMNSYVPELIEARVGQPRPIQLILSPIVSDGRYRGYCSGIVDPSRLESLLRSVAGGSTGEISILDREDRVVATTRTGLRMMEPFPRPSRGEVRDHGKEVRQWIPGPRAGESPMARWWRSYFVKEVAPTDEVPWRIVVEVSAAPLLVSLNEVSIGRFLLMALFVVFAVAVSHFASRALVMPLRRLQRNSEELHRKITAGQGDLKWPASRIAEVDGLVANFKETAQALRSSFSELRILNDTLEQRVEERAREIREREENFRALFDQVGDCILLLEIVPDGVPVIRDANAATFAQLGYDRNELIGKPVTFFDPDPDIAEHTDERQRRLFDGGTARFEVRHRCKDGSVRALECVANLFRMGGTDVIISCERDITDIRRAESEREQLRAQLREAQKMEAIGTLAGGIAHDFNNILTPLMGYAELALRRMAPDDSIREDISQVLAAARRAGELVRQILAISRHEKIDARVPVALDLLVKETVRFLRASIPANVDIRTRLEPGCPPVLGDTGQLQQVIINLCANARDSMLPKGGVLDIALESAEGPGGEPMVRLSVGDTGDGIPPENLERIFDPYFTTKPKGKGTGLGLAVTQGIVRGLGGRIHAESVVGRGSTFVVLLPALKGAVPPPAAEVIPVVPGTAAGHVLVVDDEAAIRRLLAVMLPSMGYRVTACSDAEEALALFRSAPFSFDAVLTDYTMPGMLGLDLARELLRIRPDLPVLIGSGFAEGINEEVARTTGLKKFLSKPYALDELGDALRRALEGSGR